MTVYSSCTTVVFSDTYNPSKNLRISLFFTVVDCWIKAAKTNNKIVSLSPKLKQTQNVEEIQMFSN